jgi:hypothetical protein
MYWAPYVSPYGGYPLHGWDHPANRTWNRWICEANLGDLVLYAGSIPEPVVADIQITPRTLNVKSSGGWINCRIWMPEGYDIDDVEPNSIFLEGQVQAQWRWFNENQQAVLARFGRSEVGEILETGEVEVTVSGEFSDRTTFEGRDTIRVIDKSKD